MVNPRKAYPIDPGLIPVYERTGRANLGHALEAAVLVELERRGAELGYVKTPSGKEVDFHARLPDGTEWLIQVSTEVSGSNTFQREVASLEEAIQMYPAAKPLLVTLEPIPPDSDLPRNIFWQSACEWLLSRFD